MGNWKHIVNFKWFWDNEEYTINEKGCCASKELSKLLKHFEDNFTLLDIIDDFKEVQTTPEFDNMMDGLYEWADGEFVWIKTYS